MFSCIQFNLKTFYVIKYIQYIKLKDIKQFIKGSMISRLHNLKSHENKLMFKKNKLYSLLLLSFCFNIKK